jgi:hypothetical protein
MERGCKGSADGQCGGGAELNTRRKVRSLLRYSLVSKPAVWTSTWCFMIKDVNSPHWSTVLDRVEQDTGHGLDFNFLVQMDTMHNDILPLY